VTPSTEAAEPGTISATNSIDLLRAIGAHEMRHPGGTLMEHLLRIRDLLASWGAPEYVQQSGLLHAVFAPDGSEDPMFTMLDLSYRPLVETIAGPRAAELIYFYGACDREYTYPRITEPAEQWRDRFTGEVRTPEPSLLRDLMEVTAANEVDICSHRPEFKAAHGEYLFGFFSTARHLLSPVAWQQCQDHLL